MKEKIERLSKGIFEYEIPKLQLSQTQLCILVEIGSKKQGSFFVTTKTKQKIKALLYVTGKVLSLDRYEFIATECEIKYEIDATTLTLGEKYTGIISIISDCEEVHIPFCVDVIEPSYYSSIGKIQNLDQFINLAQVNWKEALFLFQSKAFAKSILQKEARYHLVYEQLKESSDLSHAMEEFLVLIHKKEKCDFLIDVEKLEYEVGEQSEVKVITVQKINWGYLNLSIQKKAPYISLVKKQVLSEDFIENQAKIEFVIHADFMQGGNYFTELIVSSGRKEYSIPIAIRCKRKKNSFGIQKRIRQLEYQLVRKYLEFKISKISKEQFLTEAFQQTKNILKLLDKHEMEYTDIAIKSELDEKRYQYELYQAYLSIIDENNTKKEEYALVLSRKSYFERNHKVFYCVVLYLEVMKTQDETLLENYVTIIKDYYGKEKRKNILLSILLSIDKQLSQNKKNCYDTIKKHCSNKIASPIFLYEVSNLWKKDFLMLTSLDSFECQVMYYMIKQNIVDKEIALQFAYLCGDAIGQTRLQIIILKKLYEKFAHKDILLALCKKLIQCNCKEKKMHVYFSEAIKEQLRFEQLFEYYLYTSDKVTCNLINQQVLLYFICSNVPMEEAAFLYYCVIRNKDKNPAMYRAYLKKIEQFAINEMKMGKVSNFHTIIYSDVLRNSIMDIELAQMLPEIMFLYQLECTNMSMQSVCVVHKEEKEVQIIPLLEYGGVLQALVPVYTEAAKVFLVDRKGRRYPLSEEEKFYRLMHEESFLELCYGMGSKDRKLLLHIWEKKKQVHRIDKQLIELQEKISQMNGLREEIRNRCMVELIQYYYENNNIDLLEIYLNTIDLRLLSVEDREKVINLMLLREMYDRVIEGVERFGCFSAMNIQAEKISKLCIRGITSPWEERDRATLLAMGIFVLQQGKIEDRLLQYLTDRYNGTTEEMYEIWKSAKERELDTVNLEERLLAQMLFTESHIDWSFRVFVSYCNTGMNRKLIRAYFSYCSYQYFVHNQIPDIEFFEILKKEAFLEKSQICILAFLKYYSNKTYLLETEKTFVMHYMSKLIQKKVVFPFFKQFEGQVPLPSSILDKSYIEFHANPNRKLMIYYTYGKNASEWKKEVMTEMGYGIFVKELILFYGEQLEYYITEEIEGKEVVVQEKKSYCSEVNRTIIKTKYANINEILVAEKIHNSSRFLELLEQYCKEEYAVERHFTSV